MEERKDICNKVAALVASVIFTFAACAGAEQPRKTLAADTDWRGKGEVALARGETIDLAGHRLSLSAIAGSGTATDTVGGGVVYMEVPEGRSVVNTNVTFTGKLRFVKAGAGLYRQACMYQSYEGGTALVVAGLSRYRVSRQAPFRIVQLNGKVVPRTASLAPASSRQSSRRP